MSFNFARAKSVRLAAAAALLISVGAWAHGSTAGADANELPGSLYSWGANQARVLGDGLPLGYKQIVPSAAFGLDDVEDIIATEYGTFALESGTWFGLGTGYEGELCTGSVGTPETAVTTLIPATATNVSAGNCVTRFSSMAASCMGAEATRAARSMGREERSGKSSRCPP